MKYYVLLTAGTYPMFLTRSHTPNSFTWLNRPEEGNACHSKNSALQMVKEYNKLKGHARKLWKNRNGKPDYIIISEDDLAVMDIII